MKKILATASFICLSVLIALLYWRQARGENWLVCLWAGLAAPSAIWALAGLYDQRRLFFAHPAQQTRNNAFHFPLYLVFAFSLSAGMESDPRLDGSGLTLWLVVIPMLWFTLKRMAELRNKYGV